MSPYKKSEIGTGTKGSYGISILKTLKTTACGPEPPGNLSCFEQDFGLDDLQKCLPTDVIICSMNLILQVHMPASCQFFHVTVYDNLYELYMTVLLLLLGNLDKYVSVCRPELFYEFKVLNQFLLW